MMGYSMEELKAAAGADYGLGSRRTPQNLEQQHLPPS